MARPKQDGLLYFSLDTDFFYADRRIKALRSRYGSDGLIFYIYLLTEIYRNGYYIRWDEDSIDNAIADIGLTEGLIEQIMTFLVSRSLLCKSTLADSDTIITSPGIQKRYQEAVKGLRRNVYVDDRIWLLNNEETATFIKFTVNESKSCKNPNKSGINESKSCKNQTNEIKRNERKGINTMCKADALSLFERLWKIYPVKKGKGQVSDAQKMKLLKIGFDEMKRAIERYLEELKKDEWRNPQNGSTFFNSGYIDYLDGNYAPSEKSQNKNPFNNFSQNQYDFGQLEKDLLSN